MLTEYLTSHPLRLRDGAAPSGEPAGPFEQFIADRIGERIRAIL